jgi:hypothetical protein
MSRRVVRLLSLTFFLVAAPVATAWSQSGSLEARMSPSQVLPSTAWMKGESLGNTAVEQRAREKVEEMLLRRGYVAEKFSPYAIRVEIRGAGVQPVEVSIPGYNNAPSRLSLWNAATAPDMVVVSLTLYHQSSGRLLWQAEGTCRGLDANSVPGAMIVPMMDQLGRTVKTDLSCTRQS